MRHAMVLVSVFALSAGLAWAGTTGQIKGTVVDSDGQAMPGVQVTVESPAMIGGPRTVFTGPTGIFQLAALMPGDYSVMVAMDGFSTQTTEGVRLKLDEVTLLSFQLVEVAFEGEIEVTAESPVINLTKTATGQSYSEDFLQGTAVSSANRQFTNAIAKTAGTIQGGYQGGVEVFGSAQNENAFYIDGLSNNEPVTNNFNSRLNFDAIDEISVQTGSYNAEFGFAVGGVFNLVTKSGGNAFSGSLDARYIGENFTSSGDHFDPDEDTYSYQDLSATLGGPILRDKLWFFASLETLEEERRPADVIQTNQEERLTGLAKLTWQINDSWRLIGKANYDDYTNEYARAIPSVLPEADATDERTFKVYQLEAFGTLSDSLLLNLQYGRTDNDVNVVPASGDYDTIGHLDLLTGVFSRNYLDTQLGDELRNQLRGDLTWFVDDFGGSHQFKLGIDVSLLEFSNVRFAPGGYNYLDQGGTPFVLQPIERNSGDYEGDYRSIFIQDTWRPHRNLTVNLGIRYDNTIYDLVTTGQEVADMDQVQPRFGIVWDATGDGKTAVRGFYGEFMHPAALTLPLLANATSSPTYLNCQLMGFPDAEACEAAAAGMGMPYLADPGDYPGTGWLQVAAGGSGGLVVEEGLQGPKATQWSLGIEREIYRNTSIGLEYIDKKTERFFESTCNGNVPEPSVGADCSYMLITNDVPARRKYTGWVLTFETRAIENLSLLASYVYSDSKGSLGLTQGAGIDFDVYDMHFVNRYGYLDNHREHQVKINGFWVMPLRFTLGFGVNWTSAMPWTLKDGIATQGYGELFVEPRGNQEGDDYFQMDLQLSKAFKLGGTWDLELILSALNVTNSESGIEVCESIHGCLGTLEPGDNTEWQLPRRLEFGVRLTF